MNGHYSLPQFLADSSLQTNASIEIVIASSLIVVAGVLGLIIGFWLGSKFGRMSGELNVLKSIKNDRTRRSRSRSEYEQEVPS